MLDDFIGGQHAQTEQLSSILGSSVLTLNKSMEPSLTTLSTTTPQRDTDMEIPEGLVEELQEEKQYPWHHFTIFKQLTHLEPDSTDHTVLYTSKQTQTFKQIFLAKRRGFGLHAEPRGVKMG